jgi:hypothetical protein
VLELNWPREAAGREKYHRIYYLHLVHLCNNPKITARPPITQSVIVVHQLVKDQASSGAHRQAGMQIIIFGYFNKLVNM